MGIEEGNKLIAEFMGATIEKFHTKRNKSDEWESCLFKIAPAEEPYISRDSNDKEEIVIDYRDLNEVKVIDLKYHSSWDWLMPVVEKIAKLGYSDFVIHISVMSSNHTEVRCGYFYHSYCPNNKSIKIIKEEPPITVTWKAVIEWLQHHNKQESPLKTNT